MRQDYLQLIVSYSIALTTKASLWKHPERRKRERSKFRLIEEDLEQHGVNTYVWNSKNLQEIPLGMQKNH